MAGSHYSWLCCLAAALVANLSLTNAAVVKRSGDETTTDDITYILPIWEGALATNAQDSDINVLIDMKTKLNRTNANENTKTVLGWSFSSFAMSRDTNGKEGDFHFDSTNLVHELELAEQAQLPILVHINDGHWAAGSFPNATNGYPSDTLIEYLANEHPNTTMQLPNGQSIYNSVSGNQYFCLSRLNTLYRTYKKRNVQASGVVLASWAQNHSDLFAGVSLDSETHLGVAQSDHNPYSIEEWKQWLQGTGIYGPGGDYFGTARVPQFDSIESFNDEMGTNFSSWDALVPPDTVTPGDIFSEEWQRWRIMLITHAVSDETLWLIQSGIDRSQVYGHQTPQVDFYGMGDDFAESTASLGAGGMTNYGWDPINFGHLTAALRARGKNNWGNFELNPLSSNASLGYEELVAFYDHGIKIACPNAWEDYAHIRDMYAIHDSADYGDAWEDGLGLFLSEYSDKARHMQPVPWNPGVKVLDLYDSFQTATVNTGPDNHLEPNGSCGGVIRKSIYSAVGGQLSWSVELPAVSASDGERLNLWTSVGIQDGAGVGGGVAFQITIDGSSQLLSSYGYNLAQNFWVWKRWIPLMVDVTQWAGQSITVSLAVTGSDTFGWTMWGAPQVFKGPSGTNLALNKNVTTSSSDGSVAEWQPSFLTDGNLDGEPSGRIGWSSAAHTTSNATEWAVVDLGSTQSIGKVVLFSRSDLIDGNGAGFPVDFKIQGSNTTGTDNDVWEDLIVEKDYPGAQAGDGQIFLFEETKVGKVRVQASKLSGIPGEKTYRLQLAGLEVYA